MFVVSDLDNARSAICILEFITGTRSAIEILIPAVKREGPQEPSKQGRNRDGGRRKERTSMLGVKKPRVESYTAQHGDHVWTSWQATAEQLGLQHRLHGDVPESRAGGRNAFERSLRVGIRVKENGELEVRSAKVGARLFAVFVVASRVRHSSPTAKVRAVLD